MDLLFAPSSIKRLGYLILVALIAFLVKSGIHNPQAYWIVFSAFFLSLITTGDSFKRRVGIILITGFAAAFAAFLAADLMAIPLLLAAYYFIVTVLCVYYGQQKPAWYMQACMINIFVILAGSGAVMLSINLDRFMFICIGVLIAAGLQIIFYPYFIRNEIQPYLVISLRNLKKLNKQIFACLLEAEYAENIYLYEKRLHVAKTKALFALSRLRQITRLAETKLSVQEKAAHEWWLTHLDLLFDNMMDYSQLRRRVTDYTTFSVCKNELTTICEEIDTCLNAIISHVRGKKYFASVDLLKQQIRQLEDNYYHVLHVASREPFVFLLFIESLGAFAKKIQTLYSYKLPTSKNLS